MNIVDGKFDFFKILTYIENEVNTMWIDNYAPTLIYYSNNSKCGRIHQTERKQTLQNKEYNTEWNTVLLHLRNLSLQKSIITVCLNFRLLITNHCLKYLLWTKSAKGWSKQLTTIKDSNLWYMVKKSEVARFLSSRWILMYFRIAFSKSCKTYSVPHYQEYT